MNIAPEHVLRTLRYIHAVTSRGGYLSRYDVDCYSQTVPPKDVEYTNSFGRMIAQMTAYQVIPPDPAGAYLAAVGWITEGDHSVELTDVGQAVLDAELHDEDDEAPEPGQVQDVLLNPENPMAIVELVRRLREAGEGMIVDPYFKHDMLTTVIESTTINRILISKKGENDLIGHALHELGKSRDRRLPEIRFSTQKEMHDRCIISASGEVSLIGGSMTGVGVNFTAIIRPSEPIQSDYRSRYGKIWDAAEPIEPRPFRIPVAPATETDTPPNQE